MKEQWSFKQNSKLKKQAISCGKCSNDGYLYFAYNYTSQRVKHGEIIKLNIETRKSTVIYSNNYEVDGIIKNDNNLIFSTRYGIINCIDSEGNIIWQYDTEIDALPRDIYQDDEYIVYLAWKMFFINIKTGNIVWKSPDTIGYASPACVRIGDYFYHNGDNEKITRYKLATGDVSWEYGQYLNIYKMLSMDNNRLLLIHTYGKLEIVDIEKNKRIVLKSILKGRIVTYPYVEGKVISFAYRYTEKPPKDYIKKQDDIIKYMFTSIRYKENGDIESIFNLELDSDVSFRCLESDDNYFYLATEDKYIYQIDKNTGNINDKKELSASCSFIENKDNNIYLMLNDGKVICFSK